jgi:hypothetical protein
VFLTPIFLARAMVQQLHLTAQEKKDLVDFLRAL